MNILALESSTQACSVSLLTDAGSFTRFELAPQQHANLMLPMVESVMKEADLSGDELDYLAFSEGPGAFTGIRIAAGVVQGLALGWDKPVIAVSTLEAIGWQAMQQSEQNACWVCLDARMKEIYLQITRLEDGRLVSESAEMINESELLTRLNQSSTVLGAGDVDKDYPEVAEQFANWLSLYPSAEAIARIAAQRFEQAASLSEKTPLPVYLRNNVAEKTQERLSRLKQA